MYDEIDILDKLAEYEDTGYSPQEIIKMKDEISKLQEEVVDYEWQEELRYESELGDDI